MLQHMPNVSLTILSTVGSYPVSAVIKNNEDCISPHTGVVTWSFTPPATTYSKITLEVYSGHGAAISTAPVATADPVSGNTATLTVVLPDDDYTLKIITHKPGAPLSYIIIEDVIKLD